MAERFNTRDVKNKEIYDSYMGILRISPNNVKGTDIDDTSQILNTLYDEDKKERTKIILSDSDGNVLPVNFTPRAFETTITKRDSSTLIDTSHQVDIINIATIIGVDDGDDSSSANSKLYVSNEMKCRSTLLINRDKDESSLDYRKSSFRIFSGGLQSISSKNITGRGWLLYPTESPNDSNYFNDKNKHKLFSEEEISIPRYKQVDNSLYKWSRKKHEMSIDKDERVIVGNKLVTQVNEFNEEVPVYYTRDYVLGHYDGHQTKNKTVSTQWGVGNSDGITDYITKLSWTRFDKLVWDSLEEILTGNLRHTKGRYNELGVNESAGDGIIDLLGLRSDDNHEYKRFAPILGTETARGTILYHAMPFHRYWYHRTRQALRGFIERRKIDLTTQDAEALEGVSSSMDKFIIEEKGLTNTSTASGSGTYMAGTLHNKEASLLESFYENDLITPASSASVGFVHSLSKNFALCNGRLLNFFNFPNISISNGEIFEIGTDVSAVAQIASDDTNKKFKHKTTWDYSAIGAMKASSSDGTYARLPNLYALFEKTPRFIRGLSWQATSDDEIAIVLDDGDSSINRTNYVPAESKSIPDFEILSSGSGSSEKVYEISNKKFGDVSKVFFHTFDHLIEKEHHQHLMFSGTSGGTTGTNDTILNYYHCSNTRGGNASHNRYYWHYGNMLNVDRTYSKTHLFAASSDKNGGAIAYSETYMFNPGNGWNDSGAFLSYCMGNSSTDSTSVYKGSYYQKYTPIPNIGLYLFNTSIFNNKGEAFTNRGAIDNNHIGFMDAEGTWHIISTEAPITASQTSDNDSIVKYDEEKSRRKFFAMKMNEAEGYIPISNIGLAGGYMKIAYSRDERSGSKSSSRNTYTDEKHNIGGYKLMSPVGVTSSNENEFYWRCLSSIPYLNPNKLGVGDIKNYITNKKKNDETVDYYDINCVTQLPTHDSFTNYKYGGKTVEVDDTCPSPAHIKLLPLIRI